MTVREALDIANQLFAKGGFVKAPRKILWSGNASLAGCEIHHGWKFQVEGHTTPTERKALREAGWRYSGGWWGRCNELPTSVVVEVHHPTHTREKPGALSFCATCGQHPTREPRPCRTLEERTPESFAAALDRPSKGLLVMGFCPAVLSKANPLAPLVDEKGRLTLFGRVVRAHVIISDPGCLPHAKTEAQQLLAQHAGD